MSEMTIAEAAEHRVVSAWKGEEPGSCGFECACGDTFDGFDTIAEATACHKALPVEEPTETVDAPKPSLVPDPRAEYIAGLRMLADLLEQNPDLKLPFYGDVSPMRVLVCNEDPQEQRKQLAMWARVLPGQKDKQPGGTTDQFLMLGANLRGFRVEVQADRDDVCERIVLGTKKVIEKVPDPDYVAAAPMVEREKVTEIVEWRCGSILSGAKSAAVAA